MKHLILFAALPALLTLTSCQERPNKQVIYSDNPLALINQHRKTMRDGAVVPAPAKLGAKETAPSAFGAAFDIQMTSVDGRAVCYGTLNRDLPDTGVADGGSVGMFLRVPFRASSLQGDQVSKSPLITDFHSGFAIQFVDNLGTDGLALFDGDDVDRLYQTKGAYKDSSSYAALCEGSSGTNRRFRKGTTYILFEFSYPKSWPDNSIEIVTPDMENLPLALLFMGVSMQPYMAFTEGGIPYNQVGKVVH